MAHQINQKERTALIVLACEAIRILHSHGAHIHCAAQTGSIYIRFSHTRQGSLRIGNHPGKKPLNYKWNVEIGGEDRIASKNSLIRYYSSEQNAIQFFEYIKDTFDQEERLRCSFATINKKQ